MLDTRANHGERWEHVGLSFLPFPVIPVVGRGANFYWFDLEARLLASQLLRQPIGDFVFVFRRAAFPTRHAMDAVRDRDQIAGHAGGLEFCLKLRLGATVASAARDVTAHTMAARQLRQDSVVARIMIRIRL
jgi:hypothetical protein